MLPYQVPSQALLVPTLPPTTTLKMNDVRLAVMWSAQGDRLQKSRSTRPLIPFSRPLTTLVSKSPEHRSNPGSASELHLCSEILVLQSGNVHWSLLDH